jgi:ribulose-5-phosphate 4-epimerase/fuculose-1-phosphate aldolase
MEMTEGYIKFNPLWIKEPIFIDQGIIDEINQIRTLLIAKGYLGVLSNGIGFGNISVRNPNTNQFFITGSATGGNPILDASHFALVERISIEENSLMCRGLTIASSESMSHAIIYNAVPAANAVIHIHNAELWKNNLNGLPTTDMQAEYGTPEMAFSIERLTEKIQSSQAVLVMGGHENGLIAYAESLHVALNLLIKHV